MMNKHIFNFIFLMLTTSLTANAESMKSKNPLNNIYAEKSASICSKDGLDDTSTWGTQRCINAVLDDSVKELNKSVKDIKDYISNFIVPANTGDATQKGYMNAFNESQKTWGSYVKKQCELVRYELSSPAAEFNYDACIARENYIRSYELRFY